MRKVLVAIVLALLVAVPAASAGNGNANGNGNTNGKANGAVKPLPADQAMPLIDAPAVVDQSTAAAVSPQDALAAMTAPGSETTLAAGYASPAAAVAAASGCSGVSAHVSWGQWPYQRVLYENIYWCAVYGSRITSYSTSVTTDQTLCTRQNVDHFTYGGGVGYSWVTIQANGTWTCPIIGVIPYSIGGWIRTAVNDWGSSEIVGHS